MWNLSLDGAKRGALGKLDETSGSEMLSEAPADLRTNLAETAFFYPQLRTNEQGRNLVLFHDARKSDALELPWIFSYERDADGNIGW